MEAKTVLASKRVRSNDDAPTSPTLPVVPVYFRPGILQVTLKVLWRDYDKQHSLAEKADEAAGQGNAEELEFDALLDQDQVWGQADDDDDLTEKALEATRSLGTTVGPKVPVPKKYHLELVSTFHDNIQKSRRKSETTVWQRAAHYANIGEL